MDGVRTDSVCESAFRNRLLELDSHIDNVALRDFKFLLRDFLPSATLEHARSAREIFLALEKKGHLSEKALGLLGECLWRVGLAGYLHILALDPEAVQRECSHLSSFRRLLFKVASELSEEDVSRLLFRLEVTRAKAAAITTGVDLLMHLEKTGTIGPEKTEDLMDAFEVINRHDLSDHVDEYRRGCLKTLEAGFPPPGNGSCPIISPPPSYSSELVPTQTFRGVVCTQGDNEAQVIKGSQLEEKIHLTPNDDEKCNDKEKSLKSFQDKVKSNFPEEPYHSVSGSSKGAIPEKFSTLSSSASSATNEGGSLPPSDFTARNFKVKILEQRLHENNLALFDDVSKGISLENAAEPESQGDASLQRGDDLDSDYYQMCRKPRGVCVIVNNQTFDADSKYLCRAGSQIDAENLSRVFKKLDFIIVPYNNLTAEQLLNVMTEVSKRDHQSYDCFVCCILSHGVEDHIAGVDGEHVRIVDLTKPLKGSACRSLRGKPKLFFIQACRGKAKQPGVDVEEDGNGDDGRSRIRKMIPSEADFLLGYSTVPGFVSYRSRSKGSWYITKLTEQLEQHAHREDLLGILTRVNDEVSKETEVVDNRRMKQIPAPLFTLRKKMVFF